MAAATMNKKYLLIGGGILLAIILAFLFFRRGGDQKTRDGAITKDNNIAPSNPYANAYNYTETVDGEREDGIVPTWAGGNGTRTKTKLSSKADFDRRVKALIGQIIEESKVDGEWYLQIKEDLTQHWELAAGREMDEAIYLAARTYAAGIYYY